MAAFFFVTAVIGAWVIIEADDGIADARSCLTMIALSACISVQALPLIERFMSAACLASAKIGGAWVAIVAGIVVDKAVTIVVDPVADLLFGRGRIAAREAFVRAQTDAVACAYIVFDNAWCRQAEGHGHFRTWADARFGHALEAGSARCVLYFLASVALRTWSLKPAGAAASAD